MGDYKDTSKGSKDKSEEWGGKDTGKTGKGWSGKGDADALDDVADVPDALDDVADVPDGVDADAIDAVKRATDKLRGQGK